MWFVQGDFFLSQQPEAPPRDHTQTRQGLLDVHSKVLRQVRQTGLQEGQLSTALQEQASESQSQAVWSVIIYASASYVALWYRVRSFRTEDLHDVCVPHREDSLWVQII